MVKSGQKLKEIRGKLSQVKFAELCKISQSSISEAENNGCANMKAANFLKICKRWNINPECLMNDIGSKHPYKHGISDEAVEMAKLLQDMSPEMREKWLGLLRATAKNQELTEV